MPWYALYVETGKEDAVSKNLNKLLKEYPLQCFIPKKIVPEYRDGTIHDSVCVLFPGYIFIRTEMNADLYYNLKQVPDLYYLVNCGEHKKDKSCGYYSIISEEEMNWIYKFTGKQGIVDYSNINIINKKVEVVSGPLKGKEGLIKKVDKRKRRAKIEVSFLNKTSLIDVGIHILSIR
ncbi:antiterminator LoaP [Paenibacillus arenosi]|uniref:Antiterminator LoaP n=1 Tax=Paenibacillus arenosi TaxID=2774142 RepID=A0ABR9AS53_9BACL|nr:antiterminator LoaP [Paenibacillus arenosi]MBD8496935.1 antiterminator LoaP [Paenibacillus arenosi]